MPKVKDIAAAIEDFAPKRLQESYDNTGLQVGSPEMEVTAVLICLDVTEDVLAEAIKRGCNMILSHHPLLFKGLKEVTGATHTQRIVIEAIRNSIAIYAAHTNLDSTAYGVSCEMADAIGIEETRPLVPGAECPDTGLGIIGETPRPVPAMEFLRNLKEIFHVKSLRYSRRTPKVVVRRVAMCGGAGSSFVAEAVKQGADVYVTGDLRYHDFTDYGLDILLADIGHFEGELCSEKIFSRVIHEKFPNFVTYYAESGKNPIGYMC